MNHDTRSDAKQGALGFWMLTALVSGNMIGSGVFLLPSALAAYGSIGLVAWGLSAVGAVLLALVFANLSRVNPAEGGPYAYCREAFGDVVGFQMAYNYWIAVVVGNSAVIVAFVGYLAVFYPHLSEHHVVTYLIELAMLWSLTGVNILGVRMAGVIQIIMTVLKLVPLLVVIAVGIFYIDPSYLTSFNVSEHSNFSALMAGITLTLWSFIGLETATVPADDVINPERNIPLATVAGTLIAAGVYVLSTLVVMGLIPIDQLAQSSAPYADAAAVVLGQFGRMIIALGALFSCLGTLNGWILVQGQIPLAAARDGLFPASFAKLSHRGAPVQGLITSGLIITVLLGLTLHDSLIKQFSVIILLATLGTLLIYLFTVCAQAVFFLQNSEHYNTPALTRSVIITVLAGFFAFFAVMGAGQETVYYGALLFFSSLPAYAFLLYRQSK